MGFTCVLIPHFILYFFFPEIKGEVPYYLSIATGLSFFAYLVLFNRKKNIESTQKI